MAGTWSKDEERLLLQLQSEATVNEELSGTSADSEFQNIHCTWCTHTHVPHILYVSYANAHVWVPYTNIP